MQVTSFLHTSQLHMNQNLSFQLAWPTGTPAIRRSSIWLGLVVVADHALSISPRSDLIAGTVSPLCGFASLEELPVL